MSEWWREWSASPAQTLPILLGALLYAIRARKLGPRLPAWRAWCFAGGIAVLLLAVVSPVDPIGERDLFWAHMLQHVLIGDLAALLIVLGVSGPILRPVLSLPAVQRMRWLMHPAVALPLWAANLYVWHFTALYEIALRNDLVHALEHACFLGFGILVWAPLFEPLPGPVWFGTGAKLLYVLAMRFVTTILGNIFWWSSTVFYPTYVAGEARYGYSPLEDQAMAGTVMMAETGLVTLVVVLVLFFRMAREGEVRQQLIDRGLDPRAVRRAVRYGRADALAARHGIVLGGADAVAPQPDAAASSSDR
jgi:putative membrane protein